MWFNIYLAFLSYLQFTYQRGCLYRLKSLGLRNNEMDITIDGFHSWMWKGIYNFKFWASRAGQLRFVDPIVPPRNEIGHYMSYDPSVPFIRRQSKDQLEDMDVSLTFCHFRAIILKPDGRFGHFLSTDTLLFTLDQVVWWDLKKMNFLPSAEHSILKTIIQNAPI